MDAHATDGADIGTLVIDRLMRTSILRRAMADYRIGSGCFQRLFNLGPKPLPHMYARIRSASEFPDLRRSVKTPKVCSYIRGEMSPIVWATGDRQTTTWVLRHLYRHPSSHMMPNIFANVYILFNHSLLGTHDGSLPCSHHVQESIVPFK
jgi:hypothetical protein